MKKLNPVNNVIFANLITLGVGFYVDNPSFIYMSTGGLLACVLIKVLEDVRV